MQAMALESFAIDGRVAESLARLRLPLRDSRQRMAVNDSWLAATAPSLLVVTQNDDYVKVPDLAVSQV
jgi:predicted nucleic acid-binding protein